MSTPRGSRRLRLAVGSICGVITSAAFLALAATAVSVTSRPAVALPAYAQQTGLPCGRCHVNPAGGGPRTKFGQAFANNGHKLPGKK